MPAKWKSLEDNIVRILKNREAKDEDDFAKRIADEYDRTILHNAQDILLGNKALVTRKSALESALRSAFKLAKSAQSESDAKKVMRTFINIGVVGYWLGAQLGQTNPPPGAVKVVSNMVVFPGAPPNVEISNTSKPEDFARVFVAKLRAHALTISITTTGATSSGAPVIVTISGIN